MGRRARTQSRKQLTYRLQHADHSIETSSELPVPFAVPRRLYGLRRMTVTNHLTRIAHAAPRPRQFGEVALHVSSFGDSRLRRQRKMRTSPTTTLRTCRDVGKSDSTNFQRPEQNLLLLRKPVTPGSAPAGFSSLPFPSAGSLPSRSLRGGGNIRESATAGKINQKGCVNCANEMAAARV